MHSMTGLKQITQSMRQRVRLSLLPLAALTCLFLLEGCSTIQPVPSEAVAETRPYHEHIAISGRFSVSYQQDSKPLSAQGRFQWRQRGDYIDIDLLSPLGQTLARIIITPGIAMLEQSGQAKRVATSASELTEQMLGWAMPADGLRDWLQGFSPTGPGTHRAVDQSAAAGFDTNGWRVRYVSWQQNDGHAYPRRIDLARLSPATSELSLRLVIDGWEPR